MAAHYQILPELNLKYVSIKGRTQLSELRDLATTYRADSQYAPHLRQLIDLSGLTEASAGFMDVLSLRNHYSRVFLPLDAPVPVA
ncbi:MAG: hypothetical protein AAGF86_20420, partial [Pseudomonadota bacterium]